MCNDSAEALDRAQRVRDSQRQYRRKPARCQRTRVSGRMIVRTMWGKEFRSLRLCRRQLVYQTARISSEIASTPSTSSMYVKPLQIGFQHDLITDDAGLIDAAAFPFHVTARGRRLSWTIRARRRRPRIRREPV